MQISRTSRAFVGFAVIGLFLSALAGAATAGSFKSLMGQMSGNTTGAKAVLSNFDTQAAEQILRRYLSDARAADDLVAGSGGPKERDFHVRFGKIAQIAEAASQQRPDRAAFRSAVIAIAAECKSCHTAYK
jgi:cytochrome c556